MRQSFLLYFIANTEYMCYYRIYRQQVIYNHTDAGINLRKYAEKIKYGKNKICG